MRYLIDSSSSKFTVQAFASGMLSVLGHSPTFAIRKFEGEIEFSTHAPEASSLRVQVDADSLEVMDDIKTKDRQEIETTMKQKVLETNKYPAILFETRGIRVEHLGAGRYRTDLNGCLVLHGVMRPAVIPVEVIPADGVLRASGEFSLLQTDFGITRASVAGGALKVKDELKFAFDIVARKQR